MALPDQWRATVPSVDDCSRTAPPPDPLRGGWNASESVAGFRRNHRLEWIGIAGWFASEYAGIRAGAGPVAAIARTVMIVLDPSTTALSTASP